MDSTATLFARPRTLLALASMALLTILGGPAKAEAEATSFRPIDRAQRALIFSPSGLETSAIEKGRVTYSYRHRAHRRMHRKGIPHRHGRVLPLWRIRKAIKTESALRVIKHSDARTGKLRVIEDPPPVDPPTDPPGDGCTWGTFGAGNLPGACWRPFADSSPFNRTLPAQVDQVQQSAAVGARTAGFGAGAPVFTGGVSDSSSDFGHSLYFSEPSDPLYTVDCTKTWGTCDVEGAQVRIPSGAKPTGGGDGHMGVVDQASGIEYDFWQVQSKPAGGGTLRVSWGGKTAIGSPDASGLGAKAVAGGYALSAGVIRPEELAAGEIDHALFMTVKCTNGTAVWPAARNTGRVCSELGLSNANAPAMGAHFYLDMSEAQISDLSLPAWKQTILRAMSRYGMFVGDTGAAYNGWTLKVQSGTSYTSLGKQDPWVELGRDLDVPTRQSSGRTLYSFDLRTAVNWDSELRVAEPCVAQGTC